MMLEIMLFNTIQHPIIIRFQDHRDDTFSLLQPFFVIRKIFFVMFFIKVVVINYVISNEDLILID